MSRSGSKLVQSCCNEDNSKQSLLASLLLLLLVSSYIDSSQPKYFRWFLSSAHLFSSLQSFTSVDSLMWNPIPSGQQYKDLVVGEQEQYKTKDTQCFTHAKFNYCQHLTASSLSSVKSWRDSYTEWTFSTTCIDLGLCTVVLTLTLTLTSIKHSSLWLCKVPSSIFTTSSL